MVKKRENTNLRLAGLFVLLVFGLIVMSLLLKVFFVIKESKFDGDHKFNVEIIDEDGVKVISFSPSVRTINFVNVVDGTKNVSKELEIPIDGKIITSSKISSKNVPFLFLKSLFPLGNRVENLTIFDNLRLFFFSRTVPSSSIYEKEISNDLNNQQKSTVISLSFTDPTIYQENLSIEVVNATDEFGLGGRLSSLVTNIGGNVILVRSGDISKKSKIVYFGEETYTVRKLSKYLNFPKEKTDKKSLSDVIIIIGEDRLEKLNF